MAATTLMYGRKHQKGLNLVTTVAMIGFHVGAVAALFFNYLGYHSIVVDLFVYASLAITLFCLNAIGDGLRDAFDVQQRQGK